MFFIYNLWILIVSIWNINSFVPTLNTQLYETYKYTNIQFMHVYAHTNKKDIHSIGNSMADKLAYDAINN